MHTLEHSDSGHAYTQITESSGHVREKIKNGRNRQKGTFDGMEVSPTVNTGERVSLIKKKEKKKKKKAKNRVLVVVMVVGGLRNGSRGFLGVWMETEK